MDVQHELLKMISGYWLSQAIHVAAKLKMADLLAGGPRPCAELAAATATHPQSLHRLLRALASVGVFKELDGQRFELTPLAEALRSDVPNSQYAVAVMMGDEHYESWGQLLYSVQTGKAAFDHIYGKPPFDFLAEHPEKARNFDAAMTGIHGNETPAMLDAFDFSGFKTLVDIGGGNGSLLAAVLQRTPKLRGLLYDLPHVIERARGNLQAAGVAERCATEPGSFFERVPAGHDAYLMRHIIHDWEDAKAVTILSHIRKAIAPAGTLLLVEMVVPPGNDPGWVKFLDLNMLLIPGGQERTEAEYRQLLGKAGFQLARIVPTRTEISVLVAQPA